MWFLLLVVETEERQLRIASLTDHRSKRLWHIATLQPHQPAPLRSREVTILYLTYSRPSQRCHLDLHTADSCNYRTTTATTTATMPARYAAVDVEALLNGRATVRSGYAAREKVSCRLGEQDCGGTVRPFHACCPENTGCVSLSLNARVRLPLLLCVFIGTGWGCW